MSAMMVAPQPEAAEAGFEVLRAGGNAVDAGVVCALVQGVVAPQMCGLGGYAVATLQSAGGEPQYLDAPALAGSEVRPEMWRERLLRPNPGGWSYFLEGKVNDVGYSSICTPGTPRLLATLLEVARRVVRRRVLVKRSHRSPRLAGPAPSGSIRGSTVRLDFYAPKPLSDQPRSD